MKIIKYTFDVPVVAMVRHIPAKSCMAVKYVTHFYLRTHATLESHDTLRYCT